MGPLAAIPLVMGGIQSLSGLVQTHKAKKEIKDMGERPDATMPQALSSSVAMAQRQADEGIPLASKSLFEQGADRAAANFTAGAGDLRSGLMGLTGATQTLTDSARQLAAQDAQQRLINQQSYQDALIAKAEEQRRLENENVLGRYDVKRAEAFGRMERGQAEKMAGMQSVLNGMAVGAELGEFQDGMFGDLIRRIGGLFDKGVTPMEPKPGYVTGGYSSENRGLKL